MALHRSIFEILAIVGSKMVDLKNFHKHSKYHQKNDGEIGQISGL
jgi:hypothetical protein